MTFPLRSAKTQPPFRLGFSESGYDGKVALLPVSLRRVSVFTPDNQLRDDMNSMQCIGEFMNEINKQASREALRVECRARRTLRALFLVLWRRICFGIFACQTHMCVNAIFFSLFLGSPRFYS